MAAFSNNVELAKVHLTKGADVSTVNKVSHCISITFHNITQHPEEALHCTTYAVASIYSANFDARAVLRHCTRQLLRDTSC
jgi:hypothetical protein